MLASGAVPLQKGFMLKFSLSVKLKWATTQALWFIQPRGCTCEDLVTLAICVAPSAFLLPLNGSEKCLSFRNVLPGLILCSGQPECNSEWPFLNRILQCYCQFILMMLDKTGARSFKKFAPEGKRCFLCDIRGYALTHPVTAFSWLWNSHQNGSEFINPRRNSERTISYSSMTLKLSNWRTIYNATAG